MIKFNAKDKNEVINNLNFVFESQDKFITIGERSSLHRNDVALTLSRKLLQNDTNRILFLSDEMDVYASVTNEQNEDLFEAERFTTFELLGQYQKKLIKLIPQFTHIIICPYPENVKKVLKALSKTKRKNGIILYSTLNRDIEERDIKTPVLRDFYFSKIIDKCSDEIYALVQSDICYNGTVELHKLK